jgi:hypothetical protein
MDKLVASLSLGNATTLFSGGEQQQPQQSQPQQEQGPANSNARMSMVLKRLKKHSSSGTSWNNRKRRSSSVSQSASDALLLAENSEESCSVASFMESSSITIASGDDEFLKEDIEASLSCTNNTNGTLVVYDPSLSSSSTPTSASLSMPPSILVAVNPPLSQSLDTWCKLLPLVTYIDSTPLDST